MEEIKQLKRSIKVFYYIFLISILLYPLKGLFALMEEDLTYLGLITSNTSKDYFLWIVFIIKFLSNILFFIGGYYLIKTLDFKNLNELFSDKKIGLFKKSGKQFLYSAFVGSLTIWVSIFDGTFASMKSNNDFLFSLYFLIIIGFFFRIFSMVLSFGKNLKDENDLTI